MQHYIAHSKYILRMRKMQNMLRTVSWDAVEVHIQCKGLKMTESNSKFFVVDVFSGETMVDNRWCRQLSATSLSILIE
jgi:hypothetical protein